MKPQGTLTAENLLTPHQEAISELTRRRADSDLVSRVESYLGNDVPEYFNPEPVLYLARHLATPNFETLRFLHLAESIGIHVVLGEDTRDRFAPHNPLKKALGQLSVCLEIGQKGGVIRERFQKMTVIDFNTYSGKRLDSVHTLWGERLPDFHTRLLKPYLRGHTTVIDDAEWIDRNDRGDLLAHYKRFLALFVAHGVLFEDYWFEDKHESLFMEAILLPAAEFIAREFGVCPLITHLTPTSGESRDFWLSYPREVMDVVRSSMLPAV